MGSNQLAPYLIRPSPALRLSYSTAGTSSSYLSSLSIIGTSSSLFISRSTVDTDITVLELPPPHPGPPAPPHFHHRCRTSGTAAPPSTLLFLPLILPPRRQLNFDLDFRSLNGNGAFAR